MHGPREPNTSLHFLSWDCGNQGKSVALGEGQRVGVNLNIWDEQQAACPFSSFFSKALVMPAIDPWTLQIRESKCWVGLNWTSGCLSFFLPLPTPTLMLWKDHTEIAQTEEPLQRRKFHNYYWPATQSSIYLPSLAGSSSFLLTSVSHIAISVSFPLTLLSVKIKNSWSLPSMFFMCREVLLNHPSWAQV